MQSSPPVWLVDFTDEVASCLHMWQESPLGCHVHCEHDVWEVSLFLAATEFVGGAQDGWRKQAPFGVDLLRLQQLLEVVELTWQAHPVAIDDELGSHLSILGVWQNHRIWLRILASSPEQIPAGLLLGTPCNVKEDNW